MKGPDYPVIEEIKDSSDAGKGIEPSRDGMLVLTFPAVPGEMPERELMFARLMGGTIQIELSAKDTGKNGAWRDNWISVETTQEQAGAIRRWFDLHAPSP